MYLVDVHHCDMKVHVPICGEDVDRFKELYKRCFYLILFNVKHTSGKVFGIGIRLGFGSKLPIKLRPRALLIRVVHWYPYRTPSGYIRGETATAYYKQSSCQWHEAAPLSVSQ
jgi:hypothetical protein